MQRRSFSIALAAGPFIAGAAQAAEPVEGKDYTRLRTPITVAVAGKVEVIEFFGYWCPHCNDFEATLEPWVKRLPKDVNFRRVPVAWMPLHEPYQKLYYALEALGVPEDIHAKVFYAVHVQRLHLDVDAGVAAFASANGIDKVKLLDAMKSFSVASKARVATQLFKSFQLDGVPTLAIAGRYVTSPGQAGGEEQALRVTEALMRISRTAA